MQPVSATGVLVGDATPGNNGGTTAEQEALTEGHMAITPGEAARLTGLGNHSGAGDQSQPAIWAYRKPSPGNATKTESNQGCKNQFLSYT